jgi:glucose uptake protein GlcU
LTTPAAAVPVDTSRLRSLQAIGIMSGVTAGAWLGAAEAPTKLVTIGISPVVISLVMVVGVFLARWSVPALLQGTSGVAADLRQAPHLIVWAILAGCIWAVANTLTIFAIRDVGLSIAFPLWNSNSLIGIFWGIVLFRELRGAERSRWTGVLAGAAVMFTGATILAIASAAHVPPANAARGVTAALAAGVLWGTMYIPYRKAYLTGMNPLSFIAFFTIGELVMMGGIALTFSGGWSPLVEQLVAARAVIFWLLLGGFVWVIGDLFQQYAVKYVGISRGIPLSNTNQLWGLLWGVLVFGELASAGSGVVMKVVGGSLIMALGAGIVAFSSVGRKEHARWQETALEEAKRYRVDPAYTRTRLLGHGSEAGGPRRSLDWLIVAAATAVFVLAGAIATAPQLDVNWNWATVLMAAMAAVAGATSVTLWRVTRFS